MSPVSGTGAFGFVVGAAGGAKKSSGGRARSSGCDGSCECTGADAAPGAVTWLGCGLESACCREKNPCGTAAADASLAHDAKSARRELALADAAAAGPVVATLLGGEAPDVGGRGLVPRLVVGAALLVPVAVPAAVLVARPAVWGARSVPWGGASVEGNGAHASGTVAVGSHGMSSKSSTRELVAVSWGESGRWC